jgi:hypothetical protein
MQIPNFHDRRAEVSRHPSGSRRPDGGRTPRDLDRVDAVVLHSMGFDWSQKSLAGYDGVDAHFAVLRRGAVIWLHDFGEYLHASDGFNRRAIAIEFEGNPPGIRGTAYKEEKFGSHEPTLSQVMAGRGLLQWLKESHGITHVFAHCQSDRVGRPNCPGPHVWYNVGEWARGLGLSDGGPGFALGDGMPIPDAWRDSKFDVTLESMFRS